MFVSGPHPGLFFQFFEKKKEIKKLFFSCPPGSYLGYQSSKKKNKKHREREKERERGRKEGK